MNENPRGVEGKAGASDIDSSVAMTVKGGPLTVVTLDTQEFMEARKLARLYSTLQGMKTPSSISVLQPWIHGFQVP
jgi:hypothetical protein